MNNLRVGDTVESMIDLQRVEFAQGDQGVITAERHGSLFQWAVRHLNTGDICWFTNGELRFVRRGAPAPYVPYLDNN